MMRYNLEKPTICIISGVAGSGKTTLGTAMAQNLLNSTLLSKDLIQDAFTSIDRSGELYGFISGPTLKILARFCDVQLTHGKTPLIDAPFTFNHHRTDEYRNWVSFFKNIAEKHGARLAIVRCLPPSQQELRRRIEQRGYTWDEWKLQHWDDFLKRDPMDFPIPHDDVYEVVSDTPAQELAKKILGEYLRATQFK